MTANDIIDRLNAIRERRAPIGYDLEGATFVSCQAFAESPHRAFCIVTDALAGDSQRVWAALTAVLEDPLVPKWVWNAHHELAVLKLAHGITLRGWEDGMALWFELFPERPKGLKYVASLLTRQPCWTTGISWDEDDESAVAAQHTETFYRYNATDAAVTIELALHPQLQAALANPAIAARYALRKRLIEALTWSSLHGIAYDRHVAATLRAQLVPAMWTAQAEVDRIAGVTLPATEDELLAMAARRWCHAVKLRKFTLPTTNPHAVAEASCVDGQPGSSHEKRPGTGSAPEIDEKTSNSGDATVVGAFNAGAPTAAAPAIAPISCTTVPVPSASADACVTSSTTI